MSASRLSLDETVAVHFTRQGKPLFRVNGRTIYMRKKLFIVLREAEALLTRTHLSAAADTQHGRGSSPRLVRAVCSRELSRVRLTVSYPSVHVPLVCNPRDLTDILMRAEGILQRLSRLRAKRKRASKLMHPDSNLGNA